MSVTTLKQQTVPKKTLIVSNVVNATLKTSSATIATILNSKEEAFRTRATKDIKKTITNATTKNLFNWLKNTKTTTTTTTPTRAVEIESDATTIPIVSTNNSKVNDTNLYETNIKSETLFCSDRDCTCLRHKFKKSTRCKYKKYNNTKKTHNNNNNNSNNNNNNSYSNDDTNNCSLLTISPLNQNQNQNNKTDETLREFSGVQTLKRFWNKRLTANKDSNHLTKSVDCLINSIDTPTLPTQLLQSELNEHASKQIARKTRTQSLHDCSPLDQNYCHTESLESLKPILTDFDFHIHLAKDNFYKYKTAEQALKLRQQSERYVKRTNHCDKKIMLDPKILINPSEHWLKGQQRKNSPKQKLSHEIITDMAKSESTDNSQSDDGNNSPVSSESTDTTTNISMDNDHQTIYLRNEKLEELPIKLDSQIDIANNYTGILNTNFDITLSQCANSHQQRTTVRLKCSNNNNNNNNSNNQKIGNELIKKSGINPQRYLSTKRSPAFVTTRKYSFKTHSRSSPRFYSCATRKMILKNTYHNSNSKIESQLCQMWSPPPSTSTSTSSSSSTTTSISVGDIKNQFSLVAQLTQQFNAIIRKDNTLLNDIKRKNGILMTRGGHIYKVIQTATFTKKLHDHNHYLNRFNSRPNDKVDNDCKIQKQQQKQQQQQIEKEEEYIKRKTSPSNVQRTIKKFERCKLSNADTVKPKVPAKSLQVLQKRTELVLKNRQQLSPQIKQAMKMKSNDKQICTKDELNDHMTLCSREEVNDFVQIDSCNKELVPTINEIEIKKEDVDNSTKLCKQIDSDDKQETFLLREENQDQKSLEEDSACNKEYKTTLCFPHEILKVTQEEANSKESYQDSHCTESEGNKESTAIIPEAPQDLDKNLNVSSNSEVDIGDDFIDEVKQRQRKQKYAEIYEKIRFRTPFFLNKASPKKYAEETDNSDISIHANNENFNITEDFKVLQISNSADEHVDKKLDHISFDNMNINESISEFISNLDNKYDNSEPRLVPNKSFIYSENSSLSPTNLNVNVKDDPLEKIAQAVNIILVKHRETKEEDKAEAEKEEEDNVFIECYNKIKIEEDQEPLYEPIEVQDQCQERVEDQQQQQHIIGSKAQLFNKEIDIPVTQLALTAPTTSFLYKIYNDRLELCKKNNGNICEVSKNSLLGSVDDIYQTIEETLQSSQSNSNASPFLTHQTKINQTIDDYEIIEDTLTKQMEKNFKFLKSTSNLSSTTYDGYEECSPQPLKQELPFLSPLSITKDINAIGKISVNHQSTMAVRNTNDELPELPELPELSKSKMYSIKTPLPIRKSNTKSLNSTVITINHNDDNEENIYDTIKGSDCYESLQPLDRSVNAKDDNNITDDDHDKIRSNAAIISCDTFSLTSNCYESISHYCPSNLSMNVESKLNGGGGDGVGGSTLTLLSTDQKTNSLYEDSSSLLNNLLRYNSSNNRILDNNISLVKDFRNNRNSYNNMKYLQRHSLRSDSDACNNNNKSGSSTSSGSIIYILGSDNSDEWMDIADNENEEGRQSQLEEQEREQEEQPKFLVIRERVKAYKSPMWSKRVREKRLHYQRKSTSCIEDDSDHYYEQLSIYNGSKKRHSLNVEDNYKNNNQLRRNRVRLSQKGKRHSYSAQTLGQTIITPDEYDSFDTDFEEIGESEHGTENYLKDMDTYNDSGVDMRNIKLPELPSPVAGNANTHSNTNQMYAIVKRFKNFIVNKKSPNNSKHKIYDNASQFYVMNNKNINNNATLSPVATTLTTTSKIESPKCSLNKELSNSERNLLACQSDITKYEPKNTIASNNITTTTTTPRTKTKPNKSLRARIRKSLVGFDNKPLIIPAPSNARSTFYVEKLNSTSLQLQQQQQQQDDTPGEMDSGFSEKVPSTDGTFSESTSEEIPISQQDQNLHNASTLKHKCSTREIKLSHSQRRRTTIGIRPQDPPPPPPPPTSTERENNVNRHNQTNTTSWYAECGVFKSSTTTQLNSDEAHFLKGVGKNNHNLSPSDNIIACGSSWYEEVGLYQTSGLSEASGSSSGSSGVSTGNEVSPVDDLAPSTMFNNEPLYQIYTAAKLEAISRDLGETDRDNNSMDGYEEVGIGRVNTVDGQDTQTADEHRTSVRPSALQLVEPKSGPSRTLWCQIPEVINSCILDTMTSRERALMEAKFEIITSEASYMKSLNLLRTHYMNHPIFRDSNHLNTRDRKALFSQIVPVHECSEKLLTELESCWQDNIMLVGLSRRIYKMAEKHFHVYVGFCENQGRMDRTLKRLRETKGLFSQNLELLESSPTSCGLSLHSFLMLPMQRITRLPLLIDAVFSKCHPNDDEYENWKLCLAIINKIVTQCNEAANRCEQAYELEKISRQLEFNAAVIRPLAIAPVGVTALGAKPRYLVKRGELTHIIWRGEDAKLTFGKKFTKSNIYAFLFSDLLVLTKRKGDELFSVFDYCPRSMLTISPGDSLPQLPTKDLNSQTNKNLILMTLLENHERKTVEMILSCPSVSEQERWLQTMKPLTAETPGEKLYEQWDCPQVIAKHAYTSNEPDVLNLEIGDVINVTRKLPDGWYQGERIRDSAVGWFPGAYTEEVNSAHVRARNLKQRHRLLTFTATYLELQKRHK